MKSESHVPDQHQASKEMRKSAGGKGGEAGDGDRSDAGGERETAQGFS